MFQKTLFVNAKLGACHKLRMINYFLIAIMVKLLAKMTIMNIFTQEHISYQFVEKYWRCSVKLSNIIQCSIGSGKTSMQMCFIPWYFVKSPVSYLNRNVVWYKSFILSISNPHFINIKTDLLKKCVCTWQQLKIVH